MKKLAVLGPKGTYSDLAVKELKSFYEIVYYSSILEVLDHVNEDMDALVPFENSLDGFVMESLDGIIKYGLTIQKQVKLSIDFNFVSYAKLSEVKEVYVQFKAYGQCQSFIIHHQLKPIITQSNIESLEKLVESESLIRGAIIPSHTSTKDFPYVQSHVIDYSKDETRFVLVSKSGSSFQENGSFSSSIIITPKEDRPGVLYAILERFKEQGINLKAILSRPRKDMMGKYRFYLEFDVNPSLHHILKDIETELEEEENCSLTCLGFYNQL